MDTSSQRLNQHYIDDSFKSTSIVDVTESYLKRYSKNLVQDENGNPKVPQLKESAFLAYKGILNIIINYARSAKIINENPLEFFDNSEYLKYCEPKKKGLRIRLYPHLISKELRTRYLDVSE